MATEDAATDEMAAGEENQDTAAPEYNAAEDEEENPEGDMEAD